MRFINTELTGHLAALRIKNSHPDIIATADTSAVIMIASVIVTPGNCKTAISKTDHFGSILIT